MRTGLFNVTTGYAGKPVLQNVSLELPAAGALCVAGPSGYGKTTLLYILAGLLKPWSGTVGAGRVSMVFQEDRLLPWCTAWENVAAPLEGDKKHLALNWLARMELPEAAGLYPHELSGGMRRRAAIARACAFGGDVLLLDEPFNGLDEALRQRIAPHIREAAPLIVMVSHNPGDAELLDAKTIDIRELDNHGSKNE